MQAYAGEPDLDRIIRFRNPPIVRKYTQPIDVRVKQVLMNGVPQDGHPLVSAEVDLLDSPVFEGRNGVISEDGLEPVVPFHIRISTGSDWVSRATVPTDPANPYREFNANGVKGDPGLIQRATGITSLSQIWLERLEKLKTDVQSSSDSEKPGLLERIEFLERNLAAPPDRSAARFFPAYMDWSYQLKSVISQSSGASDKLLPNLDANAGPWQVTFWFGGWDADAAAYWVNGIVDIGNNEQSLQGTLIERPERMTDIGGHT
ncbi:hypothetical protein [Erythrobacter sp.]|uniref:hypothetical protein n=1 Tax=Erythrobacter sp. TaxID=1042 RepID=UPI001B029DA6|nr:hypothetical protein [Erythrobacter sp.]MBO6527957.1 hypothetical protein [Erythrobacter sp.]MBO6528650.1 hypothetical protein [Erythrobacter sp.]